jgi:hypothetical protein
MPCLEKINEDKLTHHSNTPSIQLEAKFLYLELNHSYTLQSSGFSFPQKFPTFSFKIYLTNHISVMYEGADFWHALRPPANTRT